mmetsp:Transcript_21250/g.42559  ORF Transcript_21250/g.42559 Transcript_21250/m.42559 type:complete len:145 (-) Transcript_21250:2915-3349(-)
MGAAIPDWGALPGALEVLAAGGKNSKSSWGSESRSTGTATLASLGSTGIVWFSTSVGMGFCRSGALRKDATPGPRFGADFGGRLALGMDSPTETGALVVGDDTDDEMPGATCIDGSERSLGAETGLGNCVGPGAKDRKGPATCG